jgi:hypothetical protein
MDEAQPLLVNIDEHQQRTGDQPLVDFNPNGDQDNPMDWSRAYKLGVVSLLALMAFTV